MTTAQARRRVTIRKYEGDDAYSWALFVDGYPRITGMDKREATWRRKKAVENLVAGRDWSAS